MEELRSGMKPVTVDDFFLPERPQKSRFKLFPFLKDFARILCLIMTFGKLKNASFLKKHTLFRSRSFLQRIPPRKNGLSAGGNADRPNRKGKERRSRPSMGTDDLVHGYTMTERLGHVSKSFHTASSLSRGKHGTLFSTGPLPCRRLPFSFVTAMLTV